MKSILNLCAVCLIALVIGCDSDESSSKMSVSPGAISECGVNCECCESSPNYKAPEASPGAVSECGVNCECCPNSPNYKDEASLGAIDDASDCSGAPSSCTGADASLGAVSESSCTGAPTTCSKSDG